MRGEGAGEETEGRERAEEGGGSQTGRLKKCKYTHYTTLPIKEEMC